MKKSIGISVLAIAFALSPISVNAAPASHGARALQAGSQKTLKMASGKRKHKHHKRHRKHAKRKAARTNAAA